MTESARTADKKFHADRMKVGIEQNKLAHDKLWIGRREIEIVRDAGVDDSGYMPSIACSIIKFMDTGAEQIVQDKDIMTSRAYLNL